MKNRLFAISLIILGLTSCATNSDNSASVTTVGSDKVYYIHLKSIKDSLTVHLNDLVDDFEFVPLETRDDCMANRGKCYVTNEYILFNQNKSKILQFDRTGKFIRTLVNYGKGPTEYMDAGWTVDEQKQILYMADIMKDKYFMQFDLRTGANLGNLPKAGTCRTTSIYINLDQSLMVVPYGNLTDDSYPSYIYRQDLAGNLLDAIQAPDTVVLLGGSPSFYPVGQDFRYFISGSDTAFTLRNFQKVPYMIVDYGQKNPPSITLVGHQNLIINFETDRWISMSNHIIVRTHGGVAPEGPMVYYILDKKSPRLYHQGPWFIDPTNDKLEDWTVENMTFQSNGRFNYIYQAINLLEVAKKALANPDFKEPYRSRLKAITEKITENDNPVLLIGRFKNQ